MRKCVSCDPIEDITNMACLDCYRWKKQWDEQRNTHKTSSTAKPKTFYWVGPSEEKKDNE